MSELQEARAFFAGDRYATAVTGAVIEEIGPRYAKVSLTLDPERHFNAVGGVMGGVPFTLADFAFAVASNWKGAPTVSLASQITYLSSVKGRTLFAEANCVKSGRSTCYYRVCISDELGTDVAEVTITGFIKA